MNSKPRLELLIATHNAGKIRELQETLFELPLTLRYLTEFPELSPVEEVGKTYEDNAVLKALSYSEHTGICAVADDSGLEVDALGGQPGVFSARFGGAGASDQERTEKLLRKLALSQDRKRSARFVCCIVFAGWPISESDPRSTNPRVLSLSEGKCEGVIATEMRGDGGFGYDPVFVPEGYDQTFGELSREVKRTISHRAKALNAMRTFLSEFLK